MDVTSLDKSFFQNYVDQMPNDLTEDQRKDLFKFVNSDSEIYVTENLKPNYRSLFADFNKLSDIGLKRFGEDKGAIFHFHWLKPSFERHFNYLQNLES